MRAKPDFPYPRAVRERRPICLCNSSVGRPLWRSSAAFPCPRVLLPMVRRPRSRAAAFPDARPGEERRSVRRDVVRVALDRPGRLQLPDARRRTDPCAGFADLPDLRPVRRAARPGQGRRFPLPGRKNHFPQRGAVRRRGHGTSCGQRAFRTGRAEGFRQIGALTETVPTNRTIFVFDLRWTDGGWHAAAIKLGMENTATPAPPTATR
jgi:hypothetical protein